MKVSSVADNDDDKCNEDEKEDNEELGDVQTITILRSGIYVYRVMAQNSDGVIASKSGKLIVAK